MSRSPESLCEEWYKMPMDARIVLMQAAPQFYTEMAWFAANYTVEHKRKGWRK